MADGSVPIAVSPVPFHSKERRDMAVTEGTTVRDVLMRAVDDGILPADDLPRTLPRTTVMINGEALDRATALDRRLAAGDVVNIEVSEMGGGGGRKDVGQILLTIAVIVVSAWVGGAPGVGLGLKSVFLRAVASAAVMAAGNAAVAALFAPETAQAKVNDRFALQAASNQYRPWAPFPLALGEVIVAPDLAAKTYTQAIGDDVWIHGILAPHLGACEVSEIKIGDTLVSSMGAGDWRAVEHLTPGPRDFSIYPNDVDQLDLSEELEATTSTATAVVRATPSEGERFELDFFLPAGLHFQKDDGRIIAATVTITIRHREIDAEGDPVGAGTWTTVTRTLTSTTKEPMRVTQPVTLPLGLYEFEVKRSVKPDDNAKRQDRLAWTALRCIAFRKPVVDETLSLIEFAVRASALNQGTLAPITCRIIPKVPTWDGEAWTAPVASSNPAALVRWLLTGPAAARPLSAEEADVRLRTWSALCDDYGWTCNIYLADARTQAEALGLIGDSGRASLFWDGTQMAASPWVEKPSPRQLFAGDNLKDHRWKILYPEPVHALRVEYQNIDEGAEPDEVYVYADGYGETASEGIIAASLVEALRLEGQKTSERAYRDGRWELGRRLHQRRIDTWTTSIEHLVSGYGDRVRLAWQRLDGGAAVRVRTRRWSGELVSGLRLTEPVEMLPGESYVADLRLVDRVVTAVPIVNLADTAPVMTREISFLDARAEADCPRAGDKLAFGVATRVSEDVELIGIEPGEGLTASLTGIRYVAPLLLEGETGDIPPLQTRLSRQRAANPPTPVLLGVQADPAGVRVSFAIPPWSGSPIVGFPARWRPTPAEDNDAGWLPLPAVSSTAGVLITPPVRALPGAIDDEEAATLIDIEIRAVTEAGQSSPVALSVEGLVVREDPFVPLNLTVTPATRVAPGGSSHGVLVATVDPLAAAVGIDVILEVRRAPLSGDPDAWESAGLPLTSVNPVGDVLGLRSGERYGVRAALRSPSGWTSLWTDEVRATVPAGSNVSDDTANIGGVDSDLFVTRMVDVESLAATTATAVSDLEDIYGDTASAAASAAAAALSEAAAIAAEASAIIAQGAAATSASGAASSASAASSSATSASTAASAASVSATNSAASATTSAGHAATATTQAGLAATSAGAASGSASAAAGSATSASTSATNSANSAAASQTSRLAAEAANTAAGTSASAAATSASAASGSATAAGSSASAANTSATNAATSAGAASTSAMAASGSATTAAGHASTASTAATNAATSAGLAGGSATAASGSASSAATSATAASNSATAASASQVAAASSYNATRLTSANDLPRDFVNEGATWYQGYAGLPASQTPLAASSVVSFPTVAGIGKVLQVYNPVDGFDVSQIGWIKLEAGRAYDLSLRTRAVIWSSSPSVELLWIGLDAVGTYVDDGYVSIRVTSPTFDGVSGTTWETGSGLVYADSLLPLGVVHLRLMVRFRQIALPNVNTYQLQFAALEDVTGRVLAGNSATAAATSASSAATSASAAGSSATAASGSATTASTQAGLALTYAGQSSTSASGAAASAVTAGTAATTATSAAATATTQASNASASAASASSSASIAAGVSTGSLGPNAGFDDYPTTPGLPTGWAIYGYGITSDYTREPDGQGGYAIWIKGQAGVADAGIYSQTTDGSVIPGSYVFEIEAELISGAWTGSGAYCSIRNAAAAEIDSIGSIIPLATTPDTDGVASSSRVGRRRWSIFKNVTAAGARYAFVYLLAHINWGGSTAAQNIIKGYSVRLRPATPSEVAAQVYLPALSASVAATQLVVADLDANYALARYALSATTPGGAAILSLVSDSYGTVAGLSADQIYLGENTVFDNATDTWRTTTGSTLRVTAMGAAFGTDGALLEWEGSSAVSFASMSRANAYHYTANTSPYAGGSRRLVRTDLVENEAITKEWRYDSQSVTSYTSSGAMTTRVTMYSMTLTATGKKITFDGKYLLHARHSQDAWNLYVVVERLSGSTTTDVFTSKRGALAISGDGYISDWQHISFTDTPPSGSTVYTVRVYHDYTIGSPGGFVDYDVSNRILSAREHKTET